MKTHAPLPTAIILLNLCSPLIMADPAPNGLRSTLTQPPATSTTDRIQEELREEFTFAYPASLLPYLPLHIPSDKDPALVHARPPFPSLDGGLIAQLAKRDQEDANPDSTLHTLTKRVCNVGDVTCPDNFCCQPGHSCTTRKGKHVCMRRGNPSAQPDPAYKVPASQSSSASSDSDSSSLSGGAIAGIAIGAFVVICGVVGAIVFVRLRRNRGQRKGAAKGDLDQSGGGAPAYDTRLADMYGGSNVGADGGPVELGGEERQPFMAPEKGRQPPMIDTKVAKARSPAAATPQVEAVGDEPVHPGSTTAARAELPG